MSRIKAPDQVYRVGGEDCLMEVLCSAAAIDKVCLNFVSYDLSMPSGQRVEETITIYIDMLEAQVAAGDILSGRLFRLAQKSRRKAEQSQEPAEPVYVNYGGTPAKNTLDGVAVCRQFQILPGLDKPWELLALSGPGNETMAGLIIPDGPPSRAIRISLSDQKLKEFAYAIQMIVNLWGYAKFLPIMAPTVDSERERVQSQIRELALSRDAAAAAEREEDRFTVGFPPFFKADAS